MEKRLKVYAIHGFLGMASDWNACEERLRAGILGARLDFVKLNLFGPETDNAETTREQELGVAPEQSLEEWVRNFCNQVASENQSGPRPVILGYSLGGRLALQALSEQPELFAGAVIVSSSPGLENRLERLERVEADEIWAERFEDESWRFLLGAWNDLPAFGGARQELKRPEASFSRAKLAAALRGWSVGKQACQWDGLQRFQEPLLWIAGANDVKYSQLAGEVELRTPQHRVWLAPGAGHRVPWEQPQAFQEKLEDYLAGIIGSSF